MFLSGESDFLMFGPGEFEMTEEGERDLLSKWQGRSGTCISSP